MSVNISRVELVKTKFPEHYQAALDVTDPSGKNKYLLWIAKQLSKGHTSPDITSTIQFFHNNTNRFSVKDIFKYEDLKDLENIVKEIGLSNRQCKEKDKDGAVTLYEDDKLIVIRVDTKEAMVLYGSNTKWCVTMEEQQYYEDYVSQGNKFYIVICKNTSVLTSPKYAIVRKGLLDLSIYDDQDRHPRSFTQQEEITLRQVLQVIIGDLAPEHMLEKIILKTVSNQEAIDWLKTQPTRVQSFIENKRPELKFKFKTSSELIDIFSKQYRVSDFLTSLDQEQLIDLAKELVTRKGKDVDKLKAALISVLNIQDVSVFLNDSNSTVRLAALSELTIRRTPEMNEELSKIITKCLSDSSNVVRRAAAALVAPKTLLELFQSTKSVRMKKIINEVIVERISQTKVRTFVLNQSPEVLETLMAD